MKSFEPHDNEDLRMYKSERDAWLILGGVLCTGVLIGLVLGLLVVFG